MTNDTRGPLNAFGLRDSERSTRPDTEKGWLSGVKDESTFFGFLCNPGFRRDKQLLMPLLKPGSYF